MKVSIAPIATVAASFVLLATSVPANAQSLSTNPSESPSSLIGTPVNFTQAPTMSAVPSSVPSSLVSILSNVPSQRSLSLPPSRTPGAPSVSNPSGKPIPQNQNPSSTCKISQSLFLPICIGIGIKVNDYTCFELKSILPFVVSDGCVEPIKVAFDACQMKVVASTARIADESSVSPAKDKTIAGNTLGRTGNSYPTTTDGAFLNTRSSHIKSTGHVTKVDSIYVVLEESGSYAEISTPQAGVSTKALTKGVRGRRKRGRKRKVTPAESSSRVLNKKNQKTSTSAPSLSVNSSTASLNSTAEEIRTNKKNKKKVASPEGNTGTGTKHSSIHSIHTTNNTSKGGSSNSTVPKIKGSSSIQNTSKGNGTSNVVGASKSLIPTSTGGSSSAKNSKGTSKTTGTSNSTIANGGARQGGSSDIHTPYVQGKSQSDSTVSSTNLPVSASLTSVENTNETSENMMVSNITVVTDSKTFGATTKGKILKTSGASNTTKQKGAKKKGGSDHIRGKKKNKHTVPKKGKKKGKKTKGKNGGGNNKTGIVQTLDFSSDDCTKTCIEVSSDDINDDAVADDDEFICLQALAIDGNDVAIHLAYTVTDGNGVSASFTIPINLNNSASCILPLSTCVKPSISPIISTPSTAPSMLPSVLAAVPDSNIVTKSMASRKRKRRPQGA